MLVAENLHRLSTRDSSVTYQYPTQCFLSQMDGVDIILYAQVDCLHHPRPQVLNLAALIPAVMPHVRGRTTDVIIGSAVTEQYNIQQYSKVETIHRKQ